MSWLEENVTWKAQGRLGDEMMSSGFLKAVLEGNASLTKDNKRLFWDDENAYWVIQFTYMGGETGDELCDSLEEGLAKLMEGK